MILLTACERPLGSNESETAEQAAEATAVAETAQSDESAAEDEAGSEAESSEAAEPASSGEEAEPDSGGEEAEPDSGGEAAESDSSGEAAEEAESSDPNVGGGTPDSAAEEAAEESGDSEQASSSEEAGEESSAEDAGTEMEGEAAEEETAETEAETASEEGASGEEMAAEATDSEASEEEAEAMEAEEAPAESSTTIPATHTVAPGENLYRIGLKYGMSWVVLAAYNGLPNANYIRVGQVLRIPGGGAPSPAPTPTPPDETGHIDYVVQRGDTLNKIGRRFGVSWIEIAEANGLVNPNLIYAGQVLKIPTAKPDVPPSATHTVKSGETLYRISLQYGVHWLSIAQANKIAPPYVIYPGQVLTIPGG